MVLCLCWNLYAAFDFIIIFTLVKCVFEDMTCDKAPTPCSYVFAMRFHLVSEYEFVVKILYCLFIFFIFLFFVVSILHSLHVILLF